MIQEWQTAFYIGLMNIHLMLSAKCHTFIKKYDFMFDKSITLECEFYNNFTKYLFEAVKRFFSSGYEFGRR